MARVASGPASDLGALEGVDAMSAARSMPVARRVVAAIVLLEAAVVAACGVYLAVEAAIGDVAERAGAVFLAVLAVALAGGLAAVGRAVAAGRRGARAPVLVWQVLQLTAAAPALRERWYVGVPLVVAAIVAAVGVLRSDVLPEG